MCPFLLLFIFLIFPQICFICYYVSCVGCWQFGHSRAVFPPRPTVAAPWVTAVAPTAIPLVANQIPLLANPPTPRMLPTLPTTTLPTPR